MTGYAHLAYALSLAEFGVPRELHRCKGWLLEREIPGSTERDAMSCYPLFSCANWQGLEHDLEDLEGRLVSLSIVMDPFASFDIALLNRCFHVVVPFKEHLVIDMRQDVWSRMSRHHRYYVRKSSKDIDVEVVDDPIQHLDEWDVLYDTLKQRHSLKGIKAFSRTSFAKQLSVPGLTMIRAISKGQTVGAQLWFIQGEVGYSHLAANSEVGYRLGASYAIHGFAIEHFKGKVSWIDLGGGAGVDCSSKDGLREFKKGWSTDTRIAYFCGRILDRKKYSDIVEAHAIEDTHYFPAYRRGEFE